MDIVIGIILIVISLALILAVLLQSGKSHNLSGAIAGGADTFLGKSKSGDRNHVIEIITKVCAIVFFVVVLVFYVMNANNANIGGKKTGELEDVVLTETATATAEATTTTEATATK